MRPSENIRKSFKRLHVPTSAKLDEKINDEISRAFVETRNNQWIDQPKKIWKIIMKSRITRFTKVAVIVFAVLMCIHQLSHSIDGASVALAQMTEAIRRVPWMHVRAEMDTPPHEGLVEEWICFEKSIEITKRVNGSITYRDEGQDTMYIYDPLNNMVTITSLSDKYAIPRRTPMTDSPSRAIETLIETLKREGIMQLSVSIDEIDGQPVKILDVVSTIQGESVVKQDMTIIIHAESMLPIRMDTLITTEHGDRQGVVHVDFDYPSEGPENIYSLGVPEDANIVDRRPKPMIELEEDINYRFTVHPENPEQEMLILYGGVHIDLVEIPEGQFLMGSPEDEIGYPERLLQIYQKSKKEQVRRLKHPSNEDPQHLVKIVRPFYMSKYEITCAQFRKLRPEFRKMPYHVGPLNGGKITVILDQDNQPAGVSLNDAIEFCEWLCAKTGLKVRLPSEAEWEYACRAGSQKRFYWGDPEEDAGQYANLADEAYEKAAPNTTYTLNTDDGRVGLAPVGQYVPNSYGLYDMIGNIAEWVLDVYSENAFTLDPDQKSFDVNTADNKKIYVRGGNWNVGIIHSRCSSRWQASEDSISDTLRSYTGFRIIVEKP